MKYVIFLILGFSGLYCRKTEKINTAKPVWIFFLAGQSNMAGRGIVESEDTVTQPGILVLDSMGQWILAKEPLHYYEPSRRGLDCGMAFARELMRLNQDSIIIGLIPCAVGGSSVEQWLYDSIHREVKLFSNFTDQIAKADSFGEIKGILWHQGEANASPLSLLTYEMKLDSLFTRMRTATNQPDLPIAMGELGEFLSISEFKGNHIALNSILHKMDSVSSNLSLVSAKGLVHKGDSIHFNSASLRELGKRYARAFIHY